MSQDLNAATKQVMVAFLYAEKPMCLEEAIDNPTPVHQQALVALIKDDKIASAGPIGKYEIL